MNKELNELLKEIDKLFPTKKIENVADSYSFSLSRFQRGFWCFNVVDDWHKWLDKKLQSEFYGSTPQEAIRNFLEYVKENKIKVKQLSHIKSK